jgi:hypothetical protein
MTQPGSLPRSPTDIELAWSAGILDGEGCISIQAKPVRPPRVSVSHSLFLKVTMGHKPTIERLHSIFGVGSITIQDRRGPRLNDSWSWWTASRNAHAVLLAVRPYLVTKAYEADIALEFLSLPFKKQGRVPLDPKLVAERERLCALMRDAKPTARFRKTNGK